MPKSSNGKRGVRGDASEIAARGRAKESTGVKLLLPGETEPDRSIVQPGDSLDVEVNGVQPCRPYHFTVRDSAGRKLFTSTFLSDSEGNIRRTSLWPQIGLEDFHSKRRYSVEEALGRCRGQRISVSLAAVRKELARREVTFAHAFTRPLIVATDEQGHLQNAIMAGCHDALVSGFHIPFKGAARVYLVRRQQKWREGDPFRPVVLANGRPAVADAQVDDRGRLRACVGRAGELQPGAYDFVIRLLRYGYEDDEDFRLRSHDLVTRFVTGLVVRGDFMASKAVRSGCSNTMPISGRSVIGRPYFEYADTFQLGENIYGALDPLALAPGLVGKMVALYVIQHKTPAQWSVDTSLTHLAVLGGNAAVQKFLTQPGCINFNERLLWPNASQAGDYEFRFLRILGKCLL